MSRDAHTACTADHLPLHCNLQHPCSTHTSWVHFMRQETPAWTEAVKWKKRSIRIERTKQTAKPSTSAFPKEVDVLYVYKFTPFPSLSLNFFLLTVLFLKSIVLECNLYEKLHCAQRNRSLTHKSLPKLPICLLCTLRDSPKLSRLKRS